MKITKKDKKQSKVLPISEMKVGTVFEFNDGVKGLKLQDGNVLLLDFGEDDDNWLDLAHGYLTNPAKRILGQITEIIIE